MHQWTYGWISERPTVLLHLILLAISEEAIHNLCDGVWINLCRLHSSNDVPLEKCLLKREYRLRYLRRIRVFESVIIASISVVLMVSNALPRHIAAYRFTLVQPQKFWPQPLNISVWISCSGKRLCIFVQHSVRGVINILRPHKSAFNSL